MTTEEWETEPDSKDFEAHGLPCAMRRVHSGVWCGYVGISPSHPAYGKPYNGTACLDDIDVHGGLTFAEHGENSRNLTHGFYWLGFDCAHLHDYCPKYDKPIDACDKEYRNEAYVTAEVTSLARQLAAMVTKEATT